MTSPRLNPRLARMSFKLQHWLVTITYLPGELNTLADALSREERSPPTGTSKEEERARMPTTRGIHLAAGDVEGAPPHEDRQQGAAGSRLKGWN